MPAYGLALEQQQERDAAQRAETTALATRLERLETAMARIGALARR